ncbi:MAG: DNA polymerase III subunit alpha [Deltaproteobacteria bacterium]|jgi:error-prone DNA polymerase|nr:DNA polymerase III subunit alpha [Deltaproteobacteria bacterium]
MTTLLNNCSNYSLLWGGSPIEALVDKAVEEGYKAFALTDLQNLYGVHKFFSYCADKPITPIIGTTIFIKKYRFIVLARNLNGYSNISNFITRLNLENANVPSLLHLFDQNNIILSDNQNLLKILSSSPRCHPFVYAALSPHNYNLYRFAKNTGIPAAAVPPVFFVHRCDFTLHRVLRAIALKTTIARLQPVDLASPQNYLPALDNLKTQYSFAPEALSNSRHITGLCHLKQIKFTDIFPAYPVNNPAEHLRQLVFKGAESRYGELSETVIARIDFELEIILKKGFEHYFLTVKDIISKASRICGRGSGAASIVAYSLGITNVDPIKHNLDFKRFLNLDREDPPDIDIDFAWDERDQIINEVISAFNSKYCAMVCNHIHFKPRSALRETAKAFGMTSSEIKTTVYKLRKIDTWFSHGFRKYSPKLLSLPAPWPQIITIAQKLESFPRHTGVHSGGLVITSKPLSNYVPLKKATKGINVITWEKDGTEDAGLIKIDLLGNRSLAVIRDTIANLGENEIENPFTTITPLDDKPTRKLLASGHTMGIFYVESPAMRQLQKKTKVGDFEHLVIHSSIIRPAANNYIKKYIQRLKGQPYQSIHPVLDNLLSETFGIMCYQEDVSRVAVKIAGFSWKEADQLRKILSRKDRHQKLSELKQKFIKGAAANNIDLQSSQKIWKMVLSFQGYSFCKPHSASYAMVSFQSTFLKTHYPAPFLAAVISNQGGYYSTLGYISEARRMGITIKPPHINSSRYKFHASHNTILAGFMAIPELSSKTISRILESRKNRGVFTSPQDFINRIEPPQNEIEVLTATGTLNPLFQHRNQAIQLWELLLNRKNKKIKQNNTLFSENFPRQQPAIPVFSNKNPDKHSTQKLFFRHLGFLCDDHPLVFYKKQLNKIGSLIKAINLPKFVGKFVKTVGWPITSKLIITSKKQPMEFITFEDDTAIYETVLFPKAFSKYKHLLIASTPFILQGIVQNDQGAICLNLHNIYPLKSVF